MKQKTSRGLCRKNTEKRFRVEAYLPEYAFSKRFEKNTGEADGRVPPVRFEFSNEGAGLVGAREPRWSPAEIHGEAGRSESTSVFRAPFRVCGRWWWSPASTTLAATLAPADGDSGGRGSRRRELRGQN